MEIEIAALGDDQYEVVAQGETDGQVALSSEEALKDFLRKRGMSDTQIGNIVAELQPAPRKIRVVVTP
ncbi:MAG TPA: hypothetical protein VGF16_08795 [Bryobacteraceae bacterium]|jgi:hypothetical protein